MHGMQKQRRGACEERISLSATGIGPSVVRGPQPFSRQPMGRRGCQVVGTATMGNHWHPLVVAGAPSSNEAIGGC